MEKTNALTLIITLVVGVILCGALLGPVIADATKTTNTFSNEGAFFVELDPSDTYTLKYQQYANPGKVVVNGETIPVTFNQGYTLLNLDNTILRLVSNNQMQLYGEGTSYTDVANVDITLSNGTVTGTVGYGNPIATITFPKATYEHAFAISPTDAGSVMKSYDSLAKMNGDSPIKAFGVTTINGATNTNVSVEIEGNIDDGVNVTLRNRQSSAVIDTMTVSDLAINYTPVSGYIDLYDLSSITFTVTNGEYTTDVTYSAFVVPSNVTAEMTDHLTPGQISLMGAIPVMVIVALLMAAVGAIALRRAD